MAALAQRPHVRRLEGEVWTVGHGHDVRDLICRVPTPSRALVLCLKDLTTEALPRG
jgi:hypothetical protein